MAMASATWNMLSLRAVLPSSSPSTSTRCILPSIRLSRGIHLSRLWSHNASRRVPVSRVSALSAFSGLGIANRLNLEIEQAIPGFSNGCKWVAMRHGKHVPKLGLDKAPALLQGLTTELLRHGRIKTTRATARAMRKHVDHMITLAKGGSLHQR